MEINLELVAPNKPVLTNIRRFGLAEDGPAVMVAGYGVPTTTGAVTTPEGWVGWENLSTGGYDVG